MSGDAFSMVDVTKRDVRFARLLVLAVAVVVLVIAGATAQTPTPTLPPAQQCEIERVALQGQVVELRAQLVALQTQIDREALARERARVEPKADGQRWDWSLLRFVQATPILPANKP
jgi:hypothetical protein